MTMYSTPRVKGRYLAASLPTCFGTFGVECPSKELSHTLQPPQQGQRGLDVGFVVSDVDQGIWPIGRGRALLGSCNPVGEGGGEGGLPFYNLAVKSPSESGEKKREKQGKTLNC